MNARQRTRSRRSDTRNAAPDQELAQRTSRDYDQAVDNFNSAERGLSTVQASGEVARANQQSAAIAEIQASVLMAVKFPRNEDDAYGRLMKACERPTFQEKCIYKYPRGGTQIQGPSVHMSREAARVWGNLRYGFYVMFEDEERMQVRGFAWDLQVNQKIEQDAMFGKLIYRKNKGPQASGGSWIKPDERELRELVNKHGAICERNCLLKLLPPYMIEDAMRHAADCQRKQIKDSLDQERRNILTAFSTFNVVASSLSDYLGHPLAEATPEEIVDLRQIWAAIRDGQAVWSDYAGVQVTNGKAAAAQGDVTMEDLTRSQPVGNRGYVAPGDRDPGAGHQDNQPAKAAGKGRRRKQEAQQEVPPREKYLQEVAAASDLDAVQGVVERAEDDKALFDADYELVQEAGLARRQELRAADAQDPGRTTVVGEVVQDRTVQGQVIHTATGVAGNSTLERPTQPMRLFGWYRDRFAAVKSMDAFNGLVDDATADDDFPESDWEMLQNHIDQEEARLKGTGGSAP